MLDNISLEEVESQIEAYLLQQAKADALAAYVDTLMEQSEIKMLNQNNALNSASSSNASIGDKTEYADCATLNNLDKNSVIFIYSDSCPHCLRMKPIVNDLESQNYKFIWVSAADNNMRNIMNKCYSDILAGGVPQFICARNGETLVGEQSQEELQQFTANCNQ
jgi:thiol-disulfide isomerase/thioredoxin